MQICKGQEKVSTKISESPAVEWIFQAGGLKNVYSMVRKDSELEFLQLSRFKGKCWTGSDRWELTMEQGRRECYLTMSIQEIHFFLYKVFSLSCQVPATWPRWSTCSQGSGTICCIGETQFRPSLSDGGKARKTAVHRKLTPDSAEDLRTWRTGAPSLTLVVWAAEGACHGCSVLNSIFIRAVNQTFFGQTDHINS